MIVCQIDPRTIRCAMGGKESQFHTLDRIVSTLNRKANKAYLADPGTALHWKRWLNTKVRRRQRLRDGGIRVAHERQPASWAHGNDRSNRLWRAGPRCKRRDIGGKR